MSGWVPMIAGVDYRPPQASLGDPFIITPGATEDEQRSIHTAIQILDGDIKASSAPASFQGAWASFVAEWARFYADQSGWLGWFARGTYAAWEKTREYRTRLEDWRRRFTELGGSPSSPPLGLPPTSPGTDLSAITRNIAILAGIVAVVYIGSTLYRDLRPPR